MNTANVSPTGVEVFFDTNDIIVSKTDTRGVITYANQVFLGVAGYEESEMMGQPHNLIRHPDMPRCVFQLLWDTLTSGKEIFAYVVNLAKNGDHYWVLAHVTPSFDSKGQIIGYHSSRRVPEPTAVAKITPIYAALLKEEEAAGSGKAAIEAGTALLLSTLESVGMSYDEFVFSL